MAPVLVIEVGRLHGVYLMPMVVPALVLLLRLPLFVALVR